MTWSVVWSRPVGACRAVICPVGGLVALVTSVALGKNGLCRRARGGGGGLWDGQTGTWCRRAMGVLALVWNAWGGGGEGCVCVSGQVALCDGKASWLLPCGHLLVGTAALVAVVWARLLCQDCASVWSLPILSLLSIAEGLLFSVVGCWLECLQ